METLPRERFLRQQATQQEAQPRISSDGNCDMRAKDEANKTRCPDGQICIAKLEITDGPGICALRKVECVKDEDCPQSPRTSSCRLNVRAAGDGAACKETKSCGLCVLH
jgi:hypothetical protein